MAIQTSFSAVRSRRRAQEALRAGGGEFVPVDGTVGVGVDPCDVIGLRKVLRRNIRLRRSISRCHPNRVALFGRQNARRASGYRGTPGGGGRGRIVAHPHHEKFDVNSRIAAVDQDLPPIRFVDLRRVRRHEAGNVGRPGDARGVGIARADRDRNIGTQPSPAQMGADPCPHFHPVLVDEAHHRNPDSSADGVGV